MCISDCSHKILQILFACLFEHFQSGIRASWQLQLNCSSVLIFIFFLFPAPTKVNTMKQMAQIVYVSPCPNCVRGVCKIKKHHQLLYHRHQFVPILESASTSGSTTPNRLQMLEQSATSAGGLKSTPNQKQSKTADCRCLIQTILIISCNL